MTVHHLSIFPGVVSDSAPSASPREILRSRPLPFSLYPGFLCCILLSLLFSCSDVPVVDWNNPKDSTGTDYHPPTVALTNTSFHDAATGRVIAQAESENSVVAQYLWTVDGNAVTAGDTLYTTGWSTGNHTVKVTVMDNNGLTATSVATVWTGNHSPLLTAVNDTSIARTLTIQLSATDQDGTISTYLWSDSNGTWTDSSTTGSFTRTWLIGGEYAVIWGARDNEGGVSRDTFVVTAAVDLHPVLTAVQDTALSYTKTLEVELSATDADGSIVAYAWSGNGSVGNTSSLELSDADGGIDTVIWSATDNEGGVTRDTFVVRFVPAPTFSQILADSLDITSGSSTLTWLASIVNMSSEAVTYRFYWGTSSSELSLVSMGISYTVSGLNTGDIRYYRLTALNRFGDSSEVEGNVEFVTMESSEVSSSSKAVSSSSKISSSSSAWSSSSSAIVALSSVTTNTQAIWQAENAVGQLSGNDYDGYWFTFTDAGDSGNSTILPANPFSSNGSDASYDWIGEYITDECGGASLCAVMTLGDAIGYPYADFGVNFLDPQAGTDMSSKYLCFSYTATQAWRLNLEFSTTNEIAMGYNLPGWAMKKATTQTTFVKAFSTATQQSGWGTIVTVSDYLNAVLSLIFQYSGSSSDAGSVNNLNLYWLNVGTSEANCLGE
ncbi:MAG TPA: hypothetical protein VLM37_06570 [Fibrobacteraceae bacterium]|nr:hypothetical protein [Fibrobacteraceae bacterium]